MPEESWPLPEGRRVHKAAKVDQYHAIGVIGRVANPNEIALDFFVDLPSGDKEVVVRLLFVPDGFNGMLEALMQMRPELIRPLPSE